jgi:hypothetical protein
MITNVKRLPIVTGKEFDGVRCTFTGYTVTGRRRFFNPVTGKRFTEHEKKKPVTRAPELYTRVLVRMPAEEVRGVVIKRFPFTVRINERGSAHTGRIVVNPKYKTVRGE